MEVGEWVEVGSICFIEKEYVGFSVSRLLLEVNVGLLLLEYFIFREVENLIFYIKDFI